MLKPSTIHGVGVFATEDIPAGTYLPLFARWDYRFIKEATMQKLPASEYLKLHCVKNGKGYEAPANWNRMSVGWYINHSDDPNTRIKGYKYHALRDIKKDEELTVDYKIFGSKEEYGIR